MHIHQSASMAFTLAQEEVPVLDKSVFLGDARVTVTDAVIENFDQVKQALEKLDDTLVQVVIESASGRATIALSNAPRLPDTPWPASIQRLVDLEKPLDARLVSRYHALAAATLEGLTEVEKAAVTARTELGFAHKFSLWEYLQHQPENLRFLLSFWAKLLNWMKGLLKKRKHL